ncbi:MAG: transcriptional repressor [Bdellovibrionales bacterium]|nr:transcriptional repressor [Bdellovibrionales bacterium]
MKQLEQKLKQEGLRCTDARRQVFTALQASSKAQSAKDVFAALDSKASVDLVSVYRNLELFQKLGLVHEVMSGKFALCGHDHKHSDNHVHVVSVCESCGDSSELEAHAPGVCEFVNGLKANTSGLELLKSVTLKGLCPSCEQLQ